MKLKTFQAAYYSKKLHKELPEIAIPTWSVEELWGKKDGEYCFRNLLVGDAKDCAALWEEWKHSGIIVQDLEYAFYVLQQNFLFSGQRHTRWALYAGLAVEPNSIFIHEDVSPAGVENTHARMLENKADLTPIYVGFSEERRDIFAQMLQTAVKGLSPLLHYKESPDASHTLWRVGDPPTVKALETFFLQESLYLLDGHHRWSAALRVHSSKQGDGRMLACISSMGREDVLNLPIHRAVLHEPWLLPDVGLKDLQRWGCVVAKSLPLGTLDLKIYLESLPKNQFYILFAQSPVLYQIEAPVGKKSTVVEVLEDMFASKLPSSRLVPGLEPQILLEELAMGQAQAVIFLGSISPEVVRATGERGGRLPRKSTRFYPKPALGIICRPWSLGEK